MVVQVVVVALACIAASLFAIILAGVSLSVFGKLLKRADQTEKGQRL